MCNKNYEKPKLKFAELCNQEKVADTCWGNHGKEEEMRYYDTEGNGFIGFYIAEGSCTLELIRVFYYRYKGDANPVPVEPGSPTYDEMFKVLEAAGGWNGNPFDDKKGQFPDTPGDFSK